MTAPSRAAGAGPTLCAVWTLDPANSPDLIARLRPHARHSLEVVWAGEGWRDLVADCHVTLERRFPEYELLSVKQKYGVLAFQAFPRPGNGTWSPTEYAEAVSITDTYRHRSEVVCEWCAAPGRLREWRTVQELTLCDDCDARFPDPPTPRPGHER